MKGRKPFFLPSEGDELAKGGSKAAGSLTGEAYNHRERRIRLGFHLDLHTYMGFLPIGGGNA